MFSWGQRNLTLGLVNPPLLRIPFSALLNIRAPSSAPTLSYERCRNSTKVPRKAAVQTATAHLTASQNAPAECASKTNRAIEPRQPSRSHMRAFHLATPRRQQTSQPPRSQQTRWPAAQPDDAHWETAAPGSWSSPPTSRQSCGTCACSPLRKSGSTTYARLAWHASPVPHLRGWRSQPQHVRQLRRTLRAG